MADQVAAVYLRVSTEGQDEANQEPDCLRICAARGWKPAIFRERVSGASAKRPEWNKVKEAVHRAEVVAVIFWALDRAGRDRVTLFSDIEEFFRKGASVVSVKEVMVDQPPGPMRALSIFWLSQLAEIERGKIRDRTNAGLAVAKAALARDGQFVGRKSGIVRERLGRPGLGKAVMEEIEKAQASGESPARVARRLHLPDSTVRTVFWRFKQGREKGVANGT